MINYLSFAIATLICGSTLVISLQNPIHAILVLIATFFGGSFLLFLLNVEYFAILFLIVYVGAIVVLFLFIIMMLDLKLISVSQRLRDLFSFRYIFVPFLLIQIFLFFIQEQSHLSLFLLSNITENNFVLDYSKILQEVNQLRGLGNALFSEYKLGVILAALLLFISMIASILLTMESLSSRTIKEQEIFIQGLKQSTLQKKNI
jgi:NADH-quinone oxidoreductase subunit J